jgi:hypothetical protein
MKLPTFCCFFFLFGALTADTQNTRPVLSNLTATVNWSTKTLDLHFDLSDTDQDSLQIDLLFSIDGGQTFSPGALVESVGDIGFPVFPGSNKHIECQIAALAGLAPSYVVKVVAQDHHPMDIEMLVSQVDSSRLRHQLERIQGVRHRTAGLSHLNEVRESIADSLRNFGCFTREHTFTFINGYTGRNILGDIRGISEENNLIVNDAHYDSVANAPGADDNGSGIAGMLEVARILSEYPASKSIRFIGFDLEEAGLIGSVRYVEGGQLPSETIQSVINFEMIGYYSSAPNSQTFPFGFNLLFPEAYNEVVADQNRGNFITHVANTDSETLAQAFTDAATSFVPELRVISLSVPGNGSIAPDLRRSDHAPFWDAGIAALMLTDGANFRNMSYHTPGDTISDKINFAFMTQVVKATVATMAQLAGIRHGDYAMAGFSGDVSGMDENPCPIRLSVSRIKLALIPVDCLPGNSHFRIFDSNGTLIRQGQLDGYDIGLPAVPPGIYLLQLTGAGQTAVQKFWIN